VDQQAEQVHSRDAIHCPGVKNISKPHVFVYQELLICLDGGMAEFVVPEPELRLFAKEDATNFS
jgi:hypothetical protein